MKLLIGIGVAVVASIAAWMCHTQVVYLSGVPVRSAAALADTVPGTVVTLYGGVGGEGTDLVVFVTEMEHCTTTVAADAQKVRTESHCHWEEVNRTRGPFTIRSRDGEPFTIINTDYRITGPTRVIAIGMHQRMRGFGVGDGVLIIGTTTTQGIVAQEVYGGTREQYLFGLQIWTWIWGIVAVVALAVGGIAHSSAA